MRPGLRLFVGIALFLSACKEKLITIHFDSSLTTRARVLAAVDDVVATIP